VSRTFEPDDPGLRRKRVRPFRLTELEHIPREHKMMYRALLRAMPETVFEPGFSRQVAELVARHCDMQIDLWLDSIRTVDTNHLRSLIGGVRCIIVLGLAPRVEKILIEIDLSFVYRVVSNLLGLPKDKTMVDIHRPLTEIEQGVFLFVALKVVALLQQGWIHPEQLALRIEDVRNDVRATADILRYEKRWLCASWKLFYDLDVGWVRVLVPEGFARSVILTRTPPDSPLVGRLHQRIRRRLDPFRQERVEAWVEIWHIELTRGDFEQLDPGDIILLEGAEAQLSGGEISGPAQMKIGLGRRGALRGMVMSQEGRHVFEIQGFQIEPLPDVHDPIEGHGEFENPEQVVAEYETPADAPPEDQGDDGTASPDELRDEDQGLDDEDDDGDDYAEGGEGGGYEEGYADQGGGEAPPEDGGGGAQVDDNDNLAEAEPLLGDIPMVLVVELGRVQLTADEVIRLRAGQLIELGRAPTDPVDLVVNGKLVAKGELVEIEGALGVKILNLVKGQVA
jgi:flagellar motor switch protein FliM